MSRKNVWRWTLLLSMMAVLFRSTWAQEGPAPNGPPPPPGPVGPPPPITQASGKPSELPRAEIRDGGGTIQLGAVTIDPVKREVSLPCFVNMQEGLLEYALVGDTGKRHESLLATKVEPYNLQVALLLLGLKGGRPLEAQGDSRAPEGDRVQLWAAWGEGAEAKKGRLESLIGRRPGGKEELLPVADTDWVYTGSVVVDGVFLAQVQQSIVAVYRDPAAIIDNPAPEGADDTVWFANPKATPPVGTPVTLTIRAVK